MAPTRGKPSSAPLEPLAPHACKCGALKRVAWKRPTSCRRLPVLQHWLQRSLQLWNKLATAADPDWSLAHQASLYGECAEIRQAGSCSCWAARLISHLHHLDVPPAATPQLWP